MLRSEGSFWESVLSLPFMRVLGIELRQSSLYGNWASHFTDPVYSLSENTMVCSLD